MAQSNYHDGDKRDRCYFCPTRHGLQEHHIIPDRFGGEDTPENIVTVCERCHRKLERLYDKRFYESFGVDDEEGKRLQHRQCQYGDCKEMAVGSYRITGDVGGSVVAFRCEKHKPESRYRYV